MQVKRVKQKRKMQGQQLQRLDRLIAGQLNFQKNQQLQLKLELSNRARQNFIVRETNNNYSLKYDYNPLLGQQPDRSKQETNIFKAIDQLDFVLKPKFLEQSKDFVDNLDEDKQAYQRIRDQKRSFQKFDREKRREEVQEQQLQKKQVIDQTDFFNYLKSIPYSKGSKEMDQEIIYELQKKHGKLNLHQSLYPAKLRRRYNIIQNSSEESINKYSSTVLPDRQISTICRNLVVYVDSNQQSHKGLIPSTFSQQFKQTGFESCLHFSSCRFTVQNIQALLRKQLGFGEAKMEEISNDLKTNFNLKSDAVYETIQLQTDPIDLTQFKVDDNVKKQKNYSQQEKDLDKQMTTFKNRISRLANQKVVLIEESKIGDARVKSKHQQHQGFQLEQIIKIVRQERFQTNEQLRIKEHLKNVNKLRKTRGAEMTIKLELVLEYVRRFVQNKQKLNQSKQRQERFKVIKAK